MNTKKTLLAISSVLLFFSCTKIDPDSFASADHSHEYYSSTNIYKQFEPFSVTFDNISGRIASTQTSLPEDISDETHHVFVEVEISNLGWVKMPFTYLGKTLAFSVSRNVLLNLYLVSATSGDLISQTATFNFRVIAIPKEIISSGTTE